MTSNNLDGYYKSYQLCLADVMEKCKGLDRTESFKLLDEFLKDPELTLDDDEKCRCLVEQMQVFLTLKK